MDGKNGNRVVAGSFDIVTDSRSARGGFDASDR